MSKGILGKKLGMTQIFDDQGNVTPVTVIEAGPCVVVQKKSSETDGYSAVQIGFGEKREKLVNKPLKGHFSRSGVRPLRYLKEVKVQAGDDLADLDVGQTITAELFTAGDYVDVSGVSKGKGFAGVIKRWGFHRGPTTHGSHYHRGPGALGAVDPARVFKGRKLPGRMGGDRRTIQGLRVVQVDGDRNLILVRGSVPGPKGAVVYVKETVKHKKQ